MVGLCGAVNGDATAIGDGESLLRWTGAETVSRYEGDVRLSVVRHRATGTVPAEASDGTVVAVWGAVFGHRGDAGYRARRDDASESSSSYVAGLYERYGRGAFERLNGQFVAVAYTPGTDTLLLVTDRVGSRPLYYARTAGGALVFSTNVQTVPRHPGVETAFDPGLLAEYFAHRTVFGTRTPLRGVHQVAPATVHEFDVASGEGTPATYWRPEYEPVDASYATLVARFTDLFVETLRDRTREGDRYGVLLSGGGDSRLVLAALAELDRSVTAFHMNEWENDETRIARRVAEAAGVEFRFLHRDEEYVPGLLAANGPLFGFNSTFAQGHFSGFTDSLTDVDVLLSGKMAEELVGNHGGFPTRRVSVGGGTVDLPLVAPMSSASDYAAHRAGELPAYVTTPADTGPVLAGESSTATGGPVAFHGVTYPSIASLQAFNELYPLTNDHDYLDYDGLVQVSTAWSPFLDARLYGFASRYPARYRVRRRLVYDAIDRLEPDLARLPNANTGLPGTAPFAFQYATKYARKARRKWRPGTKPRPHYAHGSWTDHEGLVRSHGFVGDAIEERADVVRRLPFLSLDEARASYRAHLAGDNNAGSLYALVTFLEAPLVRRLARSG